MKRAFLVNLASSIIALIGVGVLSYLLKLETGILLYVLTGAVMVSVVVLVARDCLHRLLDDKDTLTWQYWAGIVMVLATLVLFLSASVVHAVWQMNALLAATVLAGIGSGCWMKFCWLKSLETEIREEGETECVEENPESVQENQDVLSD
jgi:Na+/melibiose symporter-like transporter